MKTIVSKIGQMRSEEKNKKRRRTIKKAAKKKIISREDQVAELINGVLELAERMAKRHIPMTLLYVCAKRICTKISKKDNLFWIICLQVQENLYLCGHKQYDDD